MPHTMRAKIECEARMLRIIFYALIVYLQHPHLHVKLRVHRGTLAAESLLLISAQNPVF